MRDISTALSQGRSLNLIFPGPVVSELEPQTPLREGLPPTYRMRADAHYVDLIESRAMQSQRAAASGLSPEVGQAPANADDPTLHAGRDLAQALSTLSSCAALLSDAPSELSRTVVGDLLKAEAWRASALLHATRVVRGELSVVRTAVSLSGALEKTVQAFQPERRVRAVALESRCNLPYGAVVVGDERMIVGAMSWSLLSSLTLLEGVSDARLTVSIGSDPGSGFVFAVSQPSVTPPAAWQTRAFDAGWADRPGGIPVLVWMLALQQTVRAHGGAVRIERSERGTTVGFTLPASV
jgi:hypothetical protein